MVTDCFLLDASFVEVNVEEKTGQLQLPQDSVHGVDGLSEEVEIKYQTEIGKHLEIILVKMFEIVGETFTKEYVQEDNWYWKHTWTTSQEKAFLDWMIRYIMSNKEATFELSGRSSLRAREIPELVKAFVWNYGWKVQD
jgi:hypothetical protein